MSAVLPSATDRSTAASSIVDGEYTLDHKYTRAEGRIYLSGVQALVRLPLMQQMRDRAAQLNTAGFISGYRGSPLGGFDLELWKARKHLAASGIQFQPGINEDLGATMVWGSQQTNLWPGAKYDGVFGMWYGKGPGVDRSGDVFKHGNAAGTSKHGGVLVLAADDHACRSSTLPHGSEGEFVSAMMPVLNPAGVQDILDMGLLGWAMSRYTGRWVGFKTIAETVESSASVNVNPHQLDIVVPTDLELPPGGLNIRWPDPPLEQEMRLHQYAVKAAHAFARANRLDKIIYDSPKARLGIVTTGKSYLDVLQALEYLGIDHKDAESIGIRVYKVGMTWPLEPQGLRNFARGLEDIVVVEEKHAFIEAQMKEQFYNFDFGLDNGRRPSIVGKYDESGEWILPSTGELTPARIARVIAKRLNRFFQSEAITARLKWIAEKEQELALPRPLFPRVPTYCSGCPHNSSTVVPEGSRAMAGIGCHGMAMWIRPESTGTVTHMGGEGMLWLGQAPFTSEEHVFVNIGDGTFFHSGSLALRQAVAAKARVTYKVLYNGYVSMTGGQPHDGELTVQRVIDIARAEGVGRLEVVTDDPDKYQSDPLPAGIPVHHRTQLDAVQRRLRDFAGVSVLVYDQACATELRRQRKRDPAIDIAKRSFIHAEVCEGCGDCSVKSNCLSVEPLETEFGRKRAINQSTCNKDTSCLKGFCPSFVTVEGGQLKKKAKGKALSPAELGPVPEPQLPAVCGSYGVVVAGVGGTGVITIGQLLGMAGHIEGKGIVTQDSAGLAQKGGATWSHVLIGNHPDDIRTTRVSMAAADLVIGCDPIVTAGKETVLRMRDGRTKVALNSYSTPTAAFVKNGNWANPAQACAAEIARAVGPQAVMSFNTDIAATRLMGDSIYTNPMLLGYAWQKGLIPLGRESLLRAMELNGVAVENNKTAFEWGRQAAHNPEAVEKLVTPAQVIELRQRETLESVVARRVEFLAAYQNAAYADTYRDFVERVRAAEATLGRTTLSEAVARNLFKLMAYKDEYEVARLHTETGFRERIATMFEGDFKVHYHLAPPLVAKRNEKGELVKRKYGPAMLGVFRVLARLKGLRGTPLDIFGRTEERRTERALIGEYRASIEQVLAGLNAGNHALAVDIARIPDQIKGFGHVKARNLAAARVQWQQLLQQWQQPAATRQAA